ESVRDAARPTFQGGYPVGRLSAAGDRPAAGLDVDVADRADALSVDVEHGRAEQVGCPHDPAPGMRPTMWSRVQSRSRSVSSWSRDTVSVTFVRSTVAIWVIGIRLGYGSSLGRSRRPIAAHHRPTWSPMRGPKASGPHNRAVSTGGPPPSGSVNSRSSI